MDDASGVRELVSSLGAEVCGIASVGRFHEAPPGFHPRDLLPTCESVVVFGKALPHATLQVEPRLLYLTAMSTCLAEIDRIALLVSCRIEGLGGGAVAIPSDAPYESWDAERGIARGLLSIKHAAALAGLGWIGASTLLINPRFGNRLMLGCVLTDLVLRTDPVIEARSCPPRCRICREECPVNALEGGSIDQGLCRTLAYGQNGRGFTVCNCNRCRRLCPYAGTGVRAVHVAATERTCGTG